jgi:hypothetical protein
LSSLLSTLVISNKGTLKKLILNYRQQLVNTHQMQTFHLATSKPILRNNEIDPCKGLDWTPVHHFMILAGKSIHPTLARS